MIILSHRGYWKEPHEKNQRVAFCRSFDAGFGTETDLRDASGQIVISHDMPRGGELLFEEVLQIMDGRNLPLALNIKADGLCREIKRLLEDYRHTNYFTFDMSIPDTVVQIKHGMKVFTGMSDLLPQPVLLDVSTGVWLDAFESDWYDPSLIDGLIGKQKKVCVVSADLHGRETMPQWKKIRECNALGSPDLMLCTDHPELAQEYFA